MVAWVRFQRIFLQVGEHVRECARVASYSREQTVHLFTPARQRRGSLDIRFKWAIVAGAVLPCLVMPHILTTAIAGSRGVLRILWRITTVCICHLFRCAFRLAFVAWLSMAFTGRAAKRPGLSGVLAGLAAFSRFCLLVRG